MQHLVCVVYIESLNRSTFYRSNEVTFVSHRMRFLNHASQQNEGKTNLLNKTISMANSVCKCLKKQFYSPICWGKMKRIKTFADYGCCVVCMYSMRVLLKRKSCKICKICIRSRIHTKLCLHHHILKKLMLIAISVNVYSVCYSL